MRLKIRAGSLVAIALVGAGALLAQPADAQPSPPVPGAQFNTPAQSDPINSIPLVGGLLKGLVPI